MEPDHLFLLTVQSSFLLGLLHGVNPCGHSWLVLAPFVSGTGKGRRVALLTTAFLAGTFLACLIPGATLGFVSAAIPPNLAGWLEVITSVILIILGTVMVVKPHLLHHHDHQHHNSDHHHCSGVTDQPRLLRHHKTTGTALFTIGFINLIIPCPTIAIMYGFALESGSPAKSTAIFAVYAFITSLAVGSMIYGIFKLTSLLRTMSQAWIEAAIMRTIGVITMFFGSYSLFFPS